MSLRSKFILIVLGGAVLPLALFGLWLTGTAERSAETLLRGRLDASLDQIVDQIGRRWISYRSQLLGLCEDPAVQALLAGEHSADAGSDHRGGGQAEPLILSLSRELREAVSHVVLYGRDGSVRRSIEPEAGTTADSDPETPGLNAAIPVYDNVTGELRGTLDARFRIGSLIPAGAGWGGVSGSVLAVFDPGGSSLLPLSIDPTLLASERFFWANEPWLTQRRTLHEPAMELSLAAPLSPFVEPFQQAVRRNLILLVVVAVGGFTLAILMSWPVTRSLRQLAGAADSVTSGELDRRVEVARADEVGRVAQAFNTMIESLQRTLRQLSQREALASVGEFASSLAHEVRNPLTSIRLDLQQLEERVADQPETLALLLRALGQIERVDQSVTGALRVARSGHIESEPVDMRRPLTAAAHEAAPRFDERSATLEVLKLGSDPLWVSGNSVALEQLFLNLFLNAAEALGAGGRAGVEWWREGGNIQVSIWDTGHGVSEEDRKKLFDPFFTTKPEGTGLGLAIAQRIAVAHGGELRARSRSGGGTRLVLTLEQATSPT